ncbi:MAG TPA: DCC1-like thiol-disulfide oxidoreductase family protein [Polyangia bacterium]|nr:DCC1-like thiol-disulfide oxidoreductase family protein [Polyangia bacterium]
MSGDASLEGAAGAPPPAPPAEAAPAAPRPPRFARWRRARHVLVDKYLTIDARSVGLGRVVVSIVMLIDLCRRIPVLDLFYTNEGLLPNHTLLWRPPTQWMFSFFFLASLREEAILCFAICAFVFLALMVGWRTTLMRFLAPVCLISLHARVTLVENGGDWTLCELILWASLLPLGRRFSVDALRASLRRRRETTAAELADRAAMHPQPIDPLETGGGYNRVVSLAALTIVLQLAISYFFNAVQKGGQTWLHGSAVHYVLYQNRMITWFGVWMRDHMTLTLSRVMSYSALATESVLPILILSPIGRPWTRRAAVLAVIGLHVGFQCFINLGIFSWAMIGYTPFLLTAAEWELFARRAARSPRRVTLYFDAGCGVCFQLARVLARLDVFQRVRLLSSADVPPGDPALTPELLARTIVAVDERGRRTTRADAVAAALRVLPLGLLWSLPLRVPGLRALAGWGYDRFARNRQTISMWLGLAACGVPGASPAPPAALPPPRAPVRDWLGRGVALLREGFTLAMLITIVNEALFINQVVPRFLKFDEPGWVKRLVAYPRFIQAWSMFASDAPTTDESVAVEAVTAEGRHVDPYSEVSGRYPYPGTEQIPSRLDNDSFFFNYSVRIPDQGVYHGAFIEWILRYPQRTGHAGDRIVRFDAYKIENDSPPPGGTHSFNVRKHIFLSWPEHR